jgi:hypothetical protein
MVDARLYLRASVLMSVVTILLGGLGSSGWVVYGQVHCLRLVWAPVKSIASAGWPSATVISNVIALRVVVGPYSTDMCRLTGRDAGLECAYDR